MRFKISLVVKLLTATIVITTIVQSILATQTDYDNEKTSLTRRSQLIRRQASATASASSDSSTLSIANGSSKPVVSVIDQIPKDGVARRKGRIPSGVIGTTPSVAETSYFDEKEDSQSERDEVARKPSRSRARSRQRSYDDRYDQDDDHFHREESDRYDYEDEGGNDFANNMFHRPMNQFNRIMGSMFDQIQMMSRGNFPNRRGDALGVAASSATSFNDDDNGYSRTSSLVINNGRTRGLVSETRNGRTQTRRVGNWDKDSDVD